MKRSPIVRLSALLVALVMFGTTPALAQSDPLTFAQRTLNKAITELTDGSLAANERVERMLGLLDRIFDVDAVSTFVLGPYAKKATGAQFAEFKRLYRVYVAHNYAGLFRRYKDVKVEMKTNSKMANGNVMVDGVIRPAGREPVALKIQLRPQEGTFKAVDLHVEGVSMPLTHRKQFESVIRRHDGKVDGLIEDLRNAVSKLDKNTDVQPDKRQQAP